QLGNWLTIHTHSSITLVAGERVRVVGRSSLQILDSNTPARICNVALAIFRDGVFVKAADVGAMFEWPFSGNQTRLPQNSGQVEITESPGAGTYVYSLRIMFAGVNTGFTPSSGSVSSRQITIERFKK